MHKCALTDQQPDAQNNQHTYTAASATLPEQTDGRPNGRTGRRTDARREAGGTQPEVFAIWQPSRHISSLYVDAGPLIFPHASSNWVDVYVFMCVQ